MVTAANGRWSRCYFYDHHRDPLPVTYWRRSGRKMRQLTVSDKLMKKVLR